MTSKSSLRTVKGIQGQRFAYCVLSLFLFAFFAAQAMSISLLSNWLQASLGLTGAEIGMVFSANFIAAMCCQPLYGFISDRVGLRRHVIVFLGIMVGLSGFFFVYVYEPLLKANLLLGASIGGAYLGLTFISGSFALESYVDRIGRHYGFEYGRARLWGSLGFALAALFSGSLFNIDPHINFYISSAMALILLPAIFALRVPPADVENSRTNGPTISLALSILHLPKFWGFMVLILGVTNLYLVFDQQFPVYFASQFATEAIGREMFGRLNSAQIFLEAGMLFIAPSIVNRTGIKNGLLIASAIMVVRITGSGMVTGPVAISAMKMLHSLELPILLVSVFRYIAAHFDSRLASTIFLVGVSFGHSLGLAVLSGPVGKAYDLFGFPNTYVGIGLGALVFWIASIFTLSPDPKEPVSDSAPPINKEV